MNLKPETNPATPSKRVAIAIDLGEAVPWHQDCCEGILRYGRAHGWSCAVTPYLVGPGGQDAAGYYDGVVGRIDAEMAQAVRAQGIPAVNHWMNSPAKGLPSIAVDTVSGAQMVGEHLITCGYRSLWYLGGQADAEAVRHVEGLSRATADAGLAPVAARLFEAGDNVTRSRESFAQFLDEFDRWLADLQTPVGLLVGESTLAMYAAQQCLARGLSVPGDVGIVVWHDDMSTSALTPSLTVVENDWFAVGYQAATLLDELMQGKTLHPQHRVIAPERLVVRDSTDVFLCEDDMVKEAMRYIAEHCRQTLTVEAVAEVLGTTDRTLRRKFDTVLGRSAKSEITRLRVERLKLMIEETAMPLGEIAEMFEFSSNGQLTRYFNKAVGMNPSAYRKKFGKKEED